MASITGAPAAKLGNEFERLWAVKHLLEVVGGQAISVGIDLLGADERGVEFWVARNDGTREAHQCKRENASRGKWSIADLEAEGVISNAKWQLARDPTYRFLFASVDKAPHLSDLSERARQYDDNENFFKHAVPTSRSLDKEFKNLCRLLGFNPESPPELACVVDFLRRFRPVAFDKHLQRAQVEAQAAPWISADPAHAVRQLERLVEESGGKTLGEADIVEYLRAAGMRLRDLAKDPSLPGQLTALRSRFDRSYKHLLIGDSVLGRTETDDLLKIISSPDGPRLILLHGPAGVGKSGVIYELGLQLLKQEIQFLPLRLDRDPPGASPYQYGTSLLLPGSPVTCLAASASDQPAVLILDQVDAIRWTSAHSSHAWDTCERVIDEALGYSNLRVIAVCRTFDAEDDPRIRAWKKRGHLIEIKIGPLGDENINAVVSRCGVRLSSLDEAQRRILSSPQCLYLWWQLHAADSKPPAFRSMTELMRRFWQMIRHKLGELKPGAYDKLLDEIARYMDNNGVLFAPRSLAAQWPDEISALVSLNVLNETPASRLIFAHQSYLDHLTVERLLREIHAGAGTVSDWLRRNDQSLFRRGQLRQLLTMLRDEDPARYIESLLDLFTASGIRFHLQHLGLQILGSAEIPTESEVDLVLNLLKVQEWINHVFAHVLSGRTSWFDALRRRGALDSWLSSIDEQQNRLGLVTVESVIDHRSKEAESLLLVGTAADIQKRLEATIWRGKLWKISDGLFAAYLELAHNGSRITEYIDWTALAKEHPTRSLELLQVCLLRLLANEDLDEAKTEKWFHETSIMTRQPLEALISAVSGHPARAWDLFLHCLDSAATKLRILRRAAKHVEFQAGKYERRRQLKRMIRLLMCLLRTAGVKLAKSEPDRLWHSAGTLGLNKPRAVNRVIASSIAGLPAAWADRAIQWLLEGDRRFTCGASKWPSGNDGQRYRSTRKVLRRFGKICSASTFSKLEAAILLHRPAHELKDFELSHDRFHTKWNGQTHLIIQRRKLFLGQYLLLSALPSRRLNANTRDWLGVLARKFGATADHLRWEPNFIGGTVISPIPQDRIALVSDKQWKQIVEKNWDPSARRWKKMGRDFVAEAGPGTFANNLAAVARLQPQRFSRLSLDFPVTIDARYIWSLLRAFAETKPPDPASAHSDWAPARAEILERFADRFSSFLADREVASAFVSMLRQRSDENWSDKVLQRLIALAKSHPDPAAQRGNAADRESRVDLTQVAINCIRGQAAGAIEGILYNHLEKLELFRPAVDSLLVDPHPAVRVAAAGIALPMLNGDRNKALDVFLRACDHPDDRVLKNHNTDRFLSYMLLEQLEHLRPLVARMVNSSVDEIASQGAEWAAAVWSHSGKLRDLVDRCAAGSEAQRKGVAEMLSREIGNLRTGKDAVALLASFFEDPDEEVRKHAAVVFRYPKAFGRDDAVWLVDRFVASQAFRKNVENFVLGLFELTIPLRPFARAIASLVNRMVTATGDQDGTQEDYWWHAGQLAPVLLRLYEQSEGDDSTRRLCLDAWDLLLQNRLGYDVLKHIDS